MEVAANTSNLLVNPGAEQSARNFPLYAWTKEDGNCDWSSLSQVTYGNKTAKPQEGALLFAPLNRDNVKYSVGATSSKTYDLNNLPGLLPGGNRPGKHKPGELTSPSGHTPGTPPFGMPSIPGLPSMKDFPGVPSLPDIPGISGMPGIPSLPGLPTDWSFTGIVGSIPIIPGVLNLQQAVDLVNDAANFFAAHTTLTQTVDVSLWKNYIDLSQQTFDFSGWYRGDDGSDKAEIFVQALGVGGVGLGQWSSGQYNGKTWKQFSLSGRTLPFGTRSIKVCLRVSKSAGHSYYAGFFDNCSLTLPIFKLPFTVSADTVQAGQTVKITPYPAFAGILYRSLNPDIAAVDSYGTVTGLKAGTAKIQVCDPVFTEVKNEATVKVTGTVAPPAPSKINITLNKLAFTAGQEKIIVTVTGTAQADLDGGASVWYCPAGEPHTSKKGWWYPVTATGMSKLELGTSTPGDYEMKLYRSSTDRRDATLVKKIPFTVALKDAPPPVPPPAPGKLEMTLNKTSFIAGSEQITLTVTGVTQTDLNNGAKIWYCPAGEPHSSTKGWWYSLAVVGNNTLTLGTSTPGSYEMRLYASTKTISDATLAGKIPFTVALKEAPPPTSKLEMAMNKTSFIAGNELAIAAVAGVTQTDLESGAKVWFCPAGEPHSSVKGWWYPLTRAGINILEMGTSTPGSYELRLYASTKTINESTLVGKIPFSVILKEVQEKPRKVLVRGQNGAEES